MKISKLSYKKKQNAIEEAENLVEPFRNWWFIMKFFGVICAFASLLLSIFFVIRDFIF
jgi:hypothetical protein